MDNIKTIESLAVSTAEKIVKMKLEGNDPAEIARKTRVKIEKVEKILAVNPIPGDTHIPEKPGVKEDPSDPPEIAKEDGLPNRLSSNDAEKYINKNPDLTRDQKDELIKRLS